MTKVLLLQKEITHRNTNPMERVPEIRLFGTSQSWKHDPQIFHKQYTQTSSSGFDRTLPDHLAPIPPHPFNKPHQRSNSMTQFSLQLKPNKPSNCNYYQNAIRICEQNQVLNKIKGHDVRVAYLNHKSHNKYKRPCTLCQAQAITKNLHFCKEQQAVNHFHSNHRQQQRVTITQQQPHLPAYNINQLHIKPPQCSQCAQQQNVNNINDDQKTLSNLSNSMFLEEAPVDMHRTSSKVVSFQEITNVPGQQNRNNGGSQYSKVTGEFCANTKNSHKIILQSRCESLVNKQDFLLQTPKKTQTIPTTNQQNPSSQPQPIAKSPTPRLQQKSLFSQPNFFPQIQKLLFELNDLGDDSNQTIYMLKDLEEMTQKHLRNRRKCIDSLNAILSRYDGCCQTTSIPNNMLFLESDSWKDTSRYSMCSPSSKKRSRIFS